MLMDGVYPTNNCIKRLVDENGNDLPMSQQPGRTWVSTSFIRSNGQLSIPTRAFDEGYPNYLTNNAPPSQVFVRVEPSQKDPSKLVFYLNGYQQPRLFLTCGKKYQFNINTRGHPFYFITNDKKQVVGNFPPTDYFVTTITVNPDLPKSFRYECAAHPGMGGEVVVLSS